MSRKNDYSGFQATGPRTRSHAPKQDSQDSRQLRDGRSKEGRPRNEDSRFLASTTLSDDDLNEQIRSFFAKDLV